MTATRYEAAATRPRRSVRRSGLTMPVVTARFVEKAWQRGCDVIVLDLEDSVPPQLKEHARTLLKDAIAAVGRGGAEVSVRINHDTVEEDVAAAVWPGLKRIKYPKTEHAYEVRHLDKVIAYYEAVRGFESGTIEIDPAIETALGVANIDEIAGASPRIRELGVAARGYDLSRDLGIEMFVDFDQFVYPRGETELAALVAGLSVRTAPFLANPSGSVTNADRALRQAEAARRCGLRVGSGGLNPAVIEAQNQGLTPTVDELADARWVLAQWADLEGASRSWRRIGDHVIDTYEAERARELLDWAECCAARDQEKAIAVAATEQLTVEE